MATPTGGQGFGVVADQLRALAEFFTGLEDTADDLAGRIADTTVSGDQTGRCCREAGDALRGGLDRLRTGVTEFGVRALDIREALNGIARGYDEADAGATGGLTAAGAEL